MKEVTLTPVKQGRPKYGKPETRTQYVGSSLVPVSGWRCNYADCQRWNTPDRDTCYGYRWKGAQYAPCDGKNPALKNRRKAKAANLFLSVNTSKPATRTKKATKWARKRSTSSTRKR